jgi:hypothetical protein
MPSPGIEASELALAGAASLRATLDPVTPVFALIDPMLGEPLRLEGAPTGPALQAAREAAWQREITPIVLAATVPLAPDQHPYLVALDGLDDPWLETTLEWAQEEREASQSGGLASDGAAVHRVGGWLQSSLTGSQLSQVLGTMLRVNTEAWTRSTYLRLIDRRVLDLVRYVVGDTRLTACFGRLQRWVYLQPLGALACLQGDGVHDASLRFSAPEWRQLEQGEAVNRAVALWLGECLQPSAARHRMPVQGDLYGPAFTAVTASRQAAEQWPGRFISDRDKTVWAALALMHPTLCKVPTGHAAIDRLLSKPPSSDEPIDPLSHIYPDIACLLQESPASHSLSKQ